MGDLLEIMQQEIRSVNSNVRTVESSVKRNSHSIKSMERCLATVEEKNHSLENENVHLKKKLLDLEYHQHRCNLVFEGITDSPSETDLQCIQKLQFMLRNIPGLNVNHFRIDRCHRLDGHFKPGVN